MPKLTVRQIDRICNRIEASQKRIMAERIRMDDLQKEAEKIEGRTFSMNFEDMSVEDVRCFLVSKD